MNVVDMINRFDISEGTVADFNSIFINNHELKRFTNDTNVSIEEMDVGERRRIVINDNIELYLSLLPPTTLVEESSVNERLRTKYTAFKNKLSEEALIRRQLENNIYDYIVKNNITKLLTPDASKAIGIDRQQVLYTLMRLSNKGKVEYTKAGTRGYIVRVVG